MQDHTNLTLDAMRAQDVADLNPFIIRLRGGGGIHALILDQKSQRNPPD
jgi:hypothetical protein